MHLNHKKLATLALIMAAVFLVIIVVYPMMFNPSKGVAPEGQVPQVVSPVTPTH
jgi:hypothetical protein